MSELARERIKELVGQISVLDQIKNEAKKWAEKRDAIHEQISILRTEMKRLKEIRDAANQKVHELKNIRERARTEQKEKRAQLLEIKNKMSLLKKKTPRHFRGIQEEIEDIDWKIQTTPLSVKDEKVLVDQVKILEKQLLINKRIKELKDTTIVLQAEERTLAIRAAFSHKKLEELAQKSQKSHEQLFNLMNEVKKLETEADIAHKKCVELRKTANNQKYVELHRKIESIKQDIQKKDKNNQAKRQKELWEEATKKAREKIKRREKLTWDEFKLLTEQESSTER